MNWFLTLDGNILLWIQEHVRKDRLDQVVTFITNLGNAGWFCLVLSVLLLFFVKYRKTGLTSLVAILIGFVITNLLLKNIINRI